MRTISALFSAFLASVSILMAQPYDATPVINPFGINQGQSHYRPAFDDLDNDGDFDILMLDAYGNNSPFVFWQNTGTSAAPYFVATPGNNPFGLQPVNFLNYFHLVDWDNDGDKDLFGGGETGFFYYQNTGSAGQPSFSAPVINPFGLVAPAGSNTLIPAIGDLDGDGLKDLVVGDYNAKVFFYKNTGTLGAPSFAAPQNAPFGYVKPAGSPVFLAPVLKDVNDDGLLDLLVGFNPGRIRLYTNIGSATAPQFGPSVANPLGLNLSSFNIWAMPIFFDMDSDGDEDLLVTSFSSLRYYENMKMASETFSPQRIQVTVVPNPTNGEAFIDLGQEGCSDDKEGEVVIRLTNTAGQSWNLNQTLQTNVVRFSMSGLPSGIYALELKLCDKLFYSTLQKF